MVNRSEVGSNTVALTLEVVSDSLQYKMYTCYGLYGNSNSVVYVHYITIIVQGRRIYYCEEFLYYKSRTSLYQDTSELRTPL